MASHMNTPDIPDDVMPVRDSKYYTPLEFNDIVSYSSDNISLLHINSRSLNKNFEYLENLLHSLNNFEFSVIGISETWLHQNSPDIFNLPNHKLVRADRQGKRGGGVAFYIAQNLQFKIRSEITLRYAETLFIEIENPLSKNVIIGLIYRPPDLNCELFCDELDLYLHKIGNESKHVFIFGDFNINFSPTSDNNNSLNFMHLMYSYGFMSIINKPTRINPHSSTQIDNIFSNVYNNTIMGGILCSEVSDHLPIFSICECKMGRNKLHDKIWYYKESKRNVELLKQNLFLEEWTDIYSINNVNLAYKCFNDKLLYYYENNIPLCRIRINRNKPRNPWITKGILKSIKTRNFLYKLHIRNPTEYNLNMYKVYRNKLTKLIRLSRRLYFSDRMKKVNRFTVKVNKTEDELTITLTISDAEKKDSGIYIMLVSEDRGGEHHGDIREVYVDVITPPSPAECEVTSSSYSPDWGEVHCSVPLGVDSEPQGSISCFQNDKKAPYLRQPEYSLDQIQAVFWMDVESSIRCCSFSPECEKGPELCLNFTYSREASSRSFSENGSQKRAETTLQQSVTSPPTGYAESSHS
ncbi:uncharacterized protein [Diadema setosum]|uniref:uncharacterized protein n=1 Tax=Diadema setosum TaxID=31175 RepID=UPI003B3B73F7